MRGKNLIGRVKKLEEKTNAGNQDLLIVPVDYGQSEQEAIARAKQENPNFNDGPPSMIMLIVSYANAQAKPDSKKAKKLPENGKK
jgi:hypothetical protein